jgi:hypothetical protein
MRVASSSNTNYIFSKMSYKLGRGALKLKKKGAVSSSGPEPQIKKDKKSKKSYVLIFSDFVLHF